VYTSLPAKSRVKVSLLTNKWEKFIPVTFPILFLKKEYKVTIVGYQRYKSGLLSLAQEIAALNDS
jgi:hypothetical protein